MTTLSIQGFTVHQGGRKILFYPLLPWPACLRFKGKKMNNSQSSFTGSNNSVKYREQERLAPPRTGVESQRIPYWFNPVPKELHAPACKRPLLLPTDKVLEQSLCALLCQAKRPPEGLAVEIADLAAHAGISPRTVSRSIGRLREAGAILTSRVWMALKVGHPRRWIHQFWIPSMLPASLEPAPPAPSPHDSLACQDGMLLLRVNLKDIEPCQQNKLHTCARSC
jgi:hypothetical protein